MFSPSLFPFIISKNTAKMSGRNLNTASFSNFYSFFFPDSQFPIDITPVKRDHDFLDKDLVEPLCR